MGLTLLSLKVFDDEGRAGFVSYVAPSMDPSGQINPSARMWYLDPDTFEVLDYEQYMLDLTEVKNKGTYYGNQDLSRTF